MVPCMRAMKCVGSYLYSIPAQGETVGAVRARYVAAAARNGRTVARYGRAEEDRAGSFRVSLGVVCSGSCWGLFVRPSLFPCRVVLGRSGRGEMSRIGGRPFLSNQTGYFLKIFYLV